ncbi:hypothetical protein A0H81_06284 [Grifola frondosa]|uniref:Uncharacterized protein n=1 Tax=Grifola frondosa TaxID=5627 RepID=A0A1C7MG92_GRIFR|nr:hypothetical protein A0H81_06284 [Grifola frondosa]
MAAMLETPSRVWRRIEAVEGRDMPSLPSLPSFDDSADQLSESTEDVSEDVQITSPIHSTPAPISSHTRSTIRPPSSTSSTARFAHSIASRSSKSALSISRATVIKQDLQESFDISSIPSLPNIRGHGTGDMDIHSSDQDTEDNSIPEDYLPPTIGDDMDGDLDISDALQSISRPNSPSIHDTATPKKTYDYSVSLKSEKQPSPFDRMRNVAFRRPLSRTRTPSLTRTTPSPSSSSSHSTPRSNSSIPYTGSEPPSPLPGISVPLPPSAGASPNAEEGEYTDALQLTLEEGTAPGLLRNNSQEGGSQGRNVSEQSQSESREPTFSSEEAPTQTDRTVDESNNSNTIRGLRSPTPFSAVFSSPGPSAVFTPTPAFQPRARARFNAPPPPLESTTPQFPSVRFAADGHRDEESTDDHDDFHTTQDTQDHDADLEDPTTPHAHKRSFLLSVINSTARPRLKFPTPHPHRTGGAQQISAPMTPGVNLQTALAGVAPRPQLRRRLSHPLAQTWTPAPAPASDTQSNSGSESPYDTGAERASFISTASSHDLTTHVRANASFDPVIGLGERGHGVGRFNAGKLNAYLHGLNRRLQEENEMLVGRLKVFEEKFGKNGDEQPTPARPQPQVQGRRARGEADA